MKEISSINSTFKVELAGEGGWISSKKDTGEYRDLFSGSGEGEGDSYAGEGGGELGNIRCVRMESEEEGNWLMGSLIRQGSRREVEEKNEGA